MASPRSGTRKDVEVGGRSVVAGSLEGSKADVAAEFSKMIVTQQAYSADTKIVTTAQRMLQDGMNFVR